MTDGQGKKVLLGEAAEHLVLARLLRRGYVASQAPRTWKADDILVYGGPRVQVQATTTGVKGSDSRRPVPGQDIFSRFSHSPAAYLVLDRIELIDR